MAIFTRCLILTTTSCEIYRKQRLLKKNKRYYQPQGLEKAKPTSSDQHQTGLFILLCSDPLKSSPTDGSGSWPRLPRAVTDERPGRHGAGRARSRLRSARHCRWLGSPRHLPPPGLRLSTTLSVYRSRVSPRFLHSGHSCRADPAPTPAAPSRSGFPGGRRQASPRANTSRQRGPCPPSVVPPSFQPRPTLLLGRRLQPATKFKAERRSPPRQRRKQCTENPDTDRGARKELGK